MQVRILASALALSLTLAWSSTARATSEPTWPYFIYAAQGTVALGSVTVALYNGITRGIDKEPSTAALVTGYVLGGVNVAASIPWFVFGTMAGTRPNEIMLGVASAHLVIGVTTIGVTLWSSRAVPRVVLVPNAVVDIGRRMTPGIAVAVVGF